MTQKFYFLNKITCVPPIAPFFITPGFICIYGLHTHTVFQHTFQRTVLLTVEELCCRIFLLLHLKEEYFLQGHYSRREIDQAFFLYYHLFLTSRGHLRI